MTQPYVFTITQQPYDMSVNPMDSAWMSCGVDASSSVTWQWYAKPRDKNKFTKLVETNIYSTVNTRILNIQICDILNGCQYKCVITRTDNGKKLRTKAATLTTDCSIPIRPPQPE